MNLASERPSCGPLELAVVVPTYNERDNVVHVLRSLQQVLAGTNWELIIVDDDSPDGTSLVAADLAASDPSVRVIRRVGRKGLASACIEGMLSTGAPYIAVMDADLQHDERILPVMLERIRRDRLDLVVGSRHIEGGSVGEFAKSRVRLSMLGTRLARLVARCDLSDPMSGFFILDRKFLNEIVYGLSGIGFKILLDIAASAVRPIRLAEVGYTFRVRKYGESKLDLNVGLEYIHLILDKLIGNVVPPRFVLYAAVGIAGLALHLSILEILRSGFNVSFERSQAVATLFAIVANFSLNNVFTFRDSRLKGREYLRGLITYAAACSIGAVANVSIANDALIAGFPWYAAASAGLGFSAVWNYAMSTVFTWRKKRRHSVAAMRNAKRAAATTVAVIGSIWTSYIPL